MEDKKDRLIIALVTPIMVPWLLFWGIRHSVRIDREAYLQAGKQPPRETKEVFHGDYDIDVEIMGTMFECLLVYADLFNTIKSGLKFILIYCLLPFIAIKTWKEDCCCTCKSG